MSPCDAFLAMILEAPDDDGPRLVYADWLEEHGETDRAELIRIQCMGGDRLREAELLAEHGSQWALPISRHVYSFKFQRGFVEEVTLPAAEFPLLACGLFRAAPIRLVRLIGAEQHMRTLTGIPQLSRVRALHLTDCHIGDDGAKELADCRFLCELRTLRLGNNLLSDEGVELIATSPHLTSLEHLVLRRNLIGDDGARWLASSTTLGRLSHLDLAENLIGEVGARALASTSRLLGLSRLDLSGQYRGAGSPRFRLRGHPAPIQAKHQLALATRFGPTVCVF
jgi:uncharacterized protein (TIGR02996 family)